MVFSTNIAIVIGPIPPGTGVKKEALPLTLDSSQSPTSLKILLSVFYTRLIPTSIITAPSLISLPFKKAG